MTQRFVRFLLVGASMVALNLALLAVLVSVLGLPYLAACVLAFVALNFVGYRLNKAYSFRLGRGVALGEVSRYYAVMAGSLTINLGLMYAAVDLLGLHYLLASLMVSGMLAVLNFAAHSGFTFGRPTARRDALSRILQVSAFYPLHGGGIEVVAGRLAAGLAEQGVEVVWMAGGEPSEWPMSEGGVTILPARSIDPLEKQIGLPWPLWSPASLWKMVREIRRADVVHIHDVLYMPSLAALALARILRRPTLITQHIGTIPFSSPVARRVIAVLNHSIGRVALGSADQVVFVGRPVMQYFEQFVRFRRPPRLISNGVDHALYAPALNRASPADVLSFLFVGRFVEKKGIHLLEACVDVPGVQWTFVGHGPRSPLAWPSLPASARVAENLRSSEVIPLYQQADLLVLPSVGEGFPLVVQEALACGTPVLVSSEVASAFPDIDPRCVFQIELSAPAPGERLRVALADLAASPERLAAARPHALALSRQWSWLACVDEYRALYEAISSSGRALADRTAGRTQSPPPA